MNVTWRKLFLCLYFLFFFPCNTILAEDIEGPTDEFLFLEDKNRDDEQSAKKQELKQRESEIQRYRQSGEELPFDLNAPTVRFDTTANKIIADGGLTLSFSSALVEADSAVIDLNNNEAEITGNVRINDVRSKVKADSVWLDLNTGAAEMSNADIKLEEGDYRIRSSTAKHMGQEVYTLNSSSITTCNCPDPSDCLPWHIDAESANIEREGYGEIWDAVLNVQDVPVLYIPYLIFPVKTERQSGFLPFTYGLGSEQGFELQTPFFWAIDHSTDMTITPMIETNTRIGGQLEFRKILSLAQDVKAGAWYFDESKRGGDLQGTDITGLNDPSIDNSRTAGYLRHSWVGEVAGQTFNYRLNGNYVSDDLIPRELNVDEIADRRSRFVDSIATLSTDFFETYSASLSGEFTQAIVNDDDTIFQRLPEVNIGGFNTFRPFGRSPYGLKLVLNNNLSSVNFIRKEGFEGIKTELKEEFKFLFYFKNYFDVELNPVVRGTLYDLSDATNPGFSPDDPTSRAELDKSTNRVVPALNLKISTGIEKVFPVAEEGLLRDILEFGLQGRREQVKRVKHSIVPQLKYLYVPSVDQSDNPQFDKNDRLAERSVLTYEVVQHWYARYDPRNQYLYGIEETTPEISDLGGLSSSDRPLEEELAFGLNDSSGNFSGLTQGSVIEFATFKLGQSFDVLEERKNNNTGGAFSDVNAELVLLPNEHFRVGADTDFDLGEQDFSAYSLDGQFRDKRGNELRSRFRFVESKVRQLETSLQVALTDTFKVGYYSRYDDLTSEFIDNKFGFRLSSDCNCWLFDVEVADESNPNETSVLFTVTLLGLGEVGNTIFSVVEDDENI